MYYDVVDKIWYDVGYYHRKEADLLRRTLTTKLDRALDVGCGPGRHLAALLSKARRVVAVDFARRMLELARADIPAQNRERIDFVQADIRFLPFRNSIADFVLNFEVLEHLPGASKDVFKSLLELRRILKLQGRLITEIPLRRHSLWRYVYPWRPSWKEIPQEFLDEYYRRFGSVVDNAFDDESIEQMLQRAQFRLSDKAFVCVLPAGLIERHPNLVKLDAILEKVPILNRFSREAIWLAEPGGRSQSHRG